MVNNKRVQQWLRGGSGFSRADFTDRGSIVGRRSARSQSGVSAGSRRSKRSNRSARSLGSNRSGKSFASRRGRNVIFPIPVPSFNMLRRGGHDNRRSTVNRVSNIVHENFSGVPSGYAGNRWNRQRIDFVSPGTPLVVKEKPGKYTHEQWIPMGDKAIKTQEPRARAYVVDFDMNYKPMLAYGAMRILFGPKASVPSGGTTGGAIDTLLWDHPNALRFDLSKLPKQPIVLNFPNQDNGPVAGFSDTWWQSTGLYIQISVRVSGRAVNGTDDGEAVAVKTYLLWDQERF